MSQRLYIGKTDNDVYDCVIEEMDSGTEDKLNKEWVAKYSAGGMFGPWRITIGDVDLYRKLEPAIRKVITNLGAVYPEAIWYFSHGEQNIRHPSQQLLDEFIANIPT